MLDRYEIGERQTSACGDPDRLARGAGPDGLASGRPSASSCVHTPHTSVALRPPVDLLDLRLPRAVRAAARADRLRVRDREGRRAAPATPSTPTAATSRAPLIVDALGWRRVLGSDGGYQPPDAPLSRGLEVHPHGGERGPRDLDRPLVRAGRLRLELPGRDELRIGVGSFDPRFHVKDTTVRLAEDLERGRRPLPGQLDPAQAPRRDRGRGLLRRRLRRPLPAADRRGHPHRVLLRDRLRPRAARASSTGARRARRRCARYHAFSGRARVEVRAGCCAPSGSSRACRRACWRAS